MLLNPNLHHRNCLIIKINRGKSLLGRFSTQALPKQAPLSSPYFSFMKKIFLTMATLASFGAAQAQQMGDMFINGGIGYSHSKPEINNGTTTAKGASDNRFFFTPSVGYQFDRNWGAGLTFKYDINRTVSTGLNNTEIKVTDRALGIGPFLRYTQPLSQMFFVYGQLNALYVNGKKSSDIGGTNTTTGKINGFDVSIMPAIGINLSRSIAVTGSFGRLGYATLRDENPNNSNIYTRTNTFDATFGNEFSLGVQWNFAGGRPHMHNRNRVEPMSETRRMDRYRDNDEDNDGVRNETPRRRRMDRNRSNY